MKPERLFRTASAARRFVLPQCVEMAQLNGVQTKRLSEALRDAFGPDALDEFLFYMLDVRREDLSLADVYTTRTFRLVRELDRQGLIPELVAAARQARPRNAEFAALAAELDLSAAGVNSGDAGKSRRYCSGS
jgi:hypothetical protein